MQFPIEKKTVSIVSKLLLLSETISRCVSNIRNVCVKFVVCEETKRSDSGQKSIRKREIYENYIYITFNKGSREKSMRAFIKWERALFHLDMWMLSLYLYK